MKRGLAVANATGTAYATYYDSGSSAALTHANASVVQNAATNPGIKFENDFTSALAGTAALVNASATIAFPKASITGDAPTPVTTAPTPTQVAAGGFLAGSSFTSDSESVKPDVTFSDETFSTDNQIIAVSTSHAVTTPVSDTIIGVVPYVFVANGSSDVYGELSSSLSIDPQKFTYIWSSVASTTLSFLTGNSLDQATTIYPLGRDVDSGTRATALAETGYGLTGSGVIITPVVQYYPYASTGASSADNNTTGVIGNDTTLTNPTIAALNLVPANTVDGYTEVQGNGGYNAGGNAATGVSTSFAPGTTNTVIITYLGASDGKSAITASGTNRQAAKLLAYNGVVFNPNPASPISPTSANSELIEQGVYTFWGFEHALTNSAGAAIVTNSSNPSASFSFQLTTNGLDQLSSAGVSLAVLNANISRAAGDGSNIQ